MTALNVPAKEIVPCPLDSFPHGFRALVIGATGAIGSAFVSHLDTHPKCGVVEALHRHSQPAIDFNQEDSIASAAAGLSELPGVQGGTEHVSENGSD